MRAYTTLPFWNLSLSLPVVILQVQRGVCHLLHLCPLTLGGGGLREEKSTAVLATPLSLLPIHKSLFYFVKNVCNTKLSSGSSINLSDVKERNKSRR